MRGAGERIRGELGAAELKAGESCPPIELVGENSEEGKGGTLGGGDRSRVGIGIAIFGAGERERGVDAGVLIGSENT